MDRPGYKSSRASSNIWAHGFTFELCGLEAHALGDLEDAGGGGGGRGEGGGDEVRVPAYEVHLDGHRVVLQRQLALPPGRVLLKWPQSVIGAYRLRGRSRIHTRRMLDPVEGGGRSSLTGWGGGACWTCCCCCWRAWSRFFSASSAAARAWTSPISVF